MDREHEFQRLTQAEQDIAEGAEHIKWQREVVGILERISACAEATEGARALLTILIKTQAQREQDGDQIRASLDGDVASPSAVPLAHVLDHQTDLEIAVQREHHGDQIRAGLDGDVVSPSTVPLARLLDHQTDLELTVQREQGGDQIRASLEGDAVSPSTVPLAQPVDHQTDLEIAVQREQDGDQSAQASKATRSHLRRYRSHSRSITKKRLSVAAILPSRVKTGRSFRLEQRRDTSGGSSRLPQHGFQIWVARGQNCAIKNSMRKGRAGCAATLVSETNPMHGFPQILDSLVQRVSRTEHGGQTIPASADTEWALDKPKGTRDEH